MPARRGAWAIYEVFATADGGELFIGVTSDQQWKRFTEVFELDEFASDARLDTNRKRIGERAWLIPALQRALARLPQSEVMCRCEKANISWSPVARPGDLFADAHLLAGRGLLDVCIDRASEPSRTAALPAVPLELGGTRERPRLRRQPPRIGEHSAEVLAEAGFAAAEIAELARARVIGAP